MDFTERNEDILKQLMEPEPDESPQAYSAFVHWVNLPPLERYAPDVIDRMTEKFNFSVITLKSYRSDFRWYERGKFIDAHFARVQFNQRVKANEEHNLRFAEETREIQNRALALSKKSLHVVEMLLDTAALSNKTQETDWVQAKQPDGTHKAVPRTTIINMDAKVSDIAPLFRAAVDVPGKVAGLPVETVPLEAHTMQGDYKGKSKAELEEMRKKLNLEKSKLKGISQTSDKIN